MNTLWLLGFPAVISATAVPMTMSVAHQNNIDSLIAKRVQMENWEKYLYSNNFSENFIIKAENSIDWSLKNPIAKPKLKIYALANAIIPIGFKLPSNLDTIKTGAFQASILPRGFSIPLSVTKIEKNAFLVAKLPKGFKWSKVDDNNIPTPGSSVIAIPAPIVNEKEIWEKYLDQSGFDQQFIKKAKHAINWASKTRGFKTMVKRLAFANTVIPKGFKLPSSLKSINVGAFQGATLPQGFTIPLGVSIIEDNAFRGSKIPQGFMLPESVAYIGTSAFEGATLPFDFVIHSRITEITWSLFENVVIPFGFTIPSSVKEIAFDAFKGSRLPQGFTIPLSVTKIYQDAFLNTKLPEDFKWSKLDNNGNPVPGSTVIEKWTQKEQWERYLKNSNFSKTFIEKAKHAIDWSSRSIISNSFANAIIPKGFTIPSSIRKIEQNSFLNAELPKGFKWSMINNNGDPITGSSVVRITIE